MENALLIGLSRQTALMRQMDIIANNLANSQTAGYRSETPLFAEYLSDNARITNLSGSSGRVSMVQDRGLLRDFSEGTMTATENPFDVAINGKGWLVVDTPDGERYTRNGQLTRNDEGTLVNPKGYPVLSTAGNINIGADEIKVTIASDGSVSTSVGEKGKLRVVFFDNENLLKKEGGTLFSSKEPPVPAENYRIVQGFVEGSNVNSIVEMTEMIKVMRSYISTSKLNEKIDELKRRSIEQLGTVS